jgi:hypothetical protein
MNLFRAARRTVVGPWEYEETQETPVNNVVHSRRIFLIE